MALDPSKWADALKSAITTAAISKLALAAVCALYWFAASRRVIPSAEPWEFRAAAFGFLLSPGPRMARRRSRTAAST